MGPVEHRHWAQEEGERRVDNGHCDQTEAGRWKVPQRSGYLLIIFNASYAILHSFVFAPEKWQ